MLIINNVYKGIKNGCCMKEKSVVITGGCGFLGSNLARTLVKTGNDVTLVVSPGKDRKNIKDIEERVDIIERRLGPNIDFKDLILDKDYFFHFAWQTDLKRSMENPQHDIEYDIGGLVNLLETCKKQKSKSKIIFSSTATIFGDTQNLPVNEKEKANPLSIYDANKLNAENYLGVYFRNYGINFSCLRLSNVFGEGQRIDNPERGIVNFMIGRALNGETMNIYGDGKWIRDYSYIQNFVDAFVLAAESEKTRGKTYVLGSGDGKTFNEVVSTIRNTVKKFTGLDTRIAHIPFPDGINQVAKRDFVADSYKFREDTGWKPNINFEDGIRRTVDSYTLIGVKNG